jgi:hypothetical protein
MTGFSWPRERIAKKAALYVAAWTAFALFFFSKTATQAGFWLGGASLKLLLASWLTQAYTWVLLTRVVLWLGRRFPIEGSRRALHVSAHVTFSVVCASLVALAVAFIAPRSSVTGGEIVPLHSFTRTVMYQTGFFQDFLAYWVVICLQYVSSYHLKYREQERLAAQLQIDEADLRAQLFGAELAGLRRQLQPELVFDTLDATAALVRDGQNGGAEDLLAALGDLLRCVLDDPLTRSVSLDRELEHVRAYLALKQLRLGGRIHPDIVTDPATRDAAMMPASIQPIVQHAVESLVHDLDAVCSITIRSARVGDLVKVEIKCSARTQLVHTRFPDFEPILENTRARLWQVYGGRFRLRPTDRGPATVVTLLIPYETVTESAHSLQQKPVQASLLEI